MAGKFSPSELTSGMTMGVEFLSKFQKAIVKNGGSPLLIWFMTLPKSEEKLDELARLAVAQHFPVPVSLIRRLTRERSKKKYDGRYVISDENFFWNILLLDELFGIPSICWSKDEDQKVPDELEAQILNKALESPLMVDHAGEKYVVTCLISDGGAELLPGEVLTEGLYTLTIAPAKYFDLDA